MTEKTRNSADAFLAGLEALAAKPLPEAVREQARMCLVDYLACAYLGQSMIASQTDAWLAALPGDRGNASLIGAGRRVSAHAAAMLNGIHSHAAELDDGHRYGMMHPGAPVFSALLAIASGEKVSGEGFLLGAIMGYEAAIRLAAAIQPGHKLKGVHATGTCGTVGATMAVAYALDFDPEQKKAALSAALTDATGLLEMIDNTSTLKPYNIGRAASAGLNAALTGLAGFCGPIDALGGRRGFLQLMAGEVNGEYLLNGFGEKYAIENIYRKPFAACRHCHSPIEAAMTAASENGVAAEEIESVRVQTYGLAVGGHDHREIAGTSSAKMSTPYSVAVALVAGKAGFQQFIGDWLVDGRVRALTEKVRVEELPELSALVPEKRGAIVTLATERGDFTCRVDYPKGEPENPITKEEINEKFMSLLEASGRDTAGARELLDRAWKADADLNALLERL